MVKLSCKHTLNGCVLHITASIPWLCSTYYSSHDPQWAMISMTSLILLILLAVKCCKLTDSNESDMEYVDYIDDWHTTTVNGETNRVNNSRHTTIILRINYVQDYHWPLLPLPLISFLIHFVISSVYTQ